MSEQAGEKTEQATPKKLEEAFSRGQFPRSPEVQTVFVLGACLLALLFSSAEMWRQFALALTSTLGHLHDTQISLESLRGQFITGVLWMMKCAGPITIAAMLGGVLAGGIQSRFQTASEALEANWERVNPVAGLQRLFSLTSATNTGLSILKLLAIAAIAYGQIVEILQDPIFYAAISPARIAEFLASSAFRIMIRIAAALAIIAAIDYGYQVWKTNRDLMMTKEEVKDEMKNAEGNAEVKARQRRRRMSPSQRKMLAEVPKADVIVTNPTHIAIALRYDRKTMKAPKIVAKGIRMNALRIREIARQHKVPIIENKPLARLMFKHGKVGGEVPAQLYAAIAEVLAWVYRTNRYKYYAEQNQK